MTREDAAETQIDWLGALELLESGTIVLASQSHNRTVRLTDDAGQRYVTQQPEIDAILRAVSQLPEDVRGKIALLTE